jgi:hypothetical protein
MFTLSKPKCDKRFSGALFRLDWSTLSKNFSNSQMSWFAISSSRRCGHDLARSIIKQSYDWSKLYWKERPPNISKRRSWSTSLCSFNDSRKHVTVGSSFKNLNFKVSTLFKDCTSYRL